MQLRRKHLEILFFPLLCISVRFFSLAFFSATCIVCWRQLRRSCVLAQDLVVSEKCSVKLTDQNFKSVIESNGMDISAFNTRICVCLLLLRYVPCLQTFRPDLGRNVLRV